MGGFLSAHATHPDASMALALAAAQLDAQARGAEGFVPTLGWLYLTDHYADAADALLAEARTRWPGVAWVGAVGVGVSACGVEYFDEPALSIMLGDLPPETFRVFSGARPLAGFPAGTAQVHADPATPDLGELVADLCDRTASSYLFGGLAASRGRNLHIADGVWRGGLSGVAFGEEVEIVSRVTQGCQPLGAARRITGADRNLVHTLDDEPALDVLLREVGLPGAEVRDALPSIRQTLVGLTDRTDSATPNAFATPARHASFGSDTRVRHIIGVDPLRRSIAIADGAVVGEHLAFCRRDTEAARRDLMRICAEIREEVESESRPAALALRNPRAPVAEGPASMAGAIYVSCSGRGGPHFGAPSAELAIVRHALGNVPLAGFFAGGEIGHRHLYGYTGVLTVFVRTP